MLWHRELTKRENGADVKLRLEFGQKVAGYGRDKLLACIL